MALARVPSEGNKKPSRAEKTAALDNELYGFLEKLDAGKNLTIIGIDEVGRGPLSGPLTIAAVSLPLEPRISGLNDSKKLSAKRREELALEIRSQARACCVCDIDAGEIDRVGISAAVRAGMSRALEGVIERLGEADAVLIDGRPLKIHKNEQAIVKGDGKVASIAAASIIAKVHRDAIMTRMSEEFPEYGWDSNKGYGSAAHMEAIKKLGLTPYHRRSFCKNIVQEQLF